MYKMKLWGGGGLFFENMRARSRSRPPTLRGIAVLVFAK